MTVGAPGRLKGEWIESRVLCEAEHRVTRTTDHVVDPPSGLPPAGLPMRLALAIQDDDTDPPMVNPPDHEVHPLPGPLRASHRAAVAIQSEDTAPRFKLPVTTGNTSQ
jgi:hypothetical protein